MEYAIILVLVIGAIIGIQLYLQRGFQGRYKAAADHALAVIAAAHGAYGIYSGIYSQYDPYYQVSDFTTESYSDILQSYSAGQSTTVIQPERASRFGIRVETP